MVRGSFFDFFYDMVFLGLPIQNVLDVGSGSGKMIDYFTKRNITCYGIDIHPTRKDIQKMDIYNSGINSDSYDLVYSAHVLEHLKDPVRFRDEVFRISKRYILIITPLPGKHFWDEPDHIRPYTCEALKRLFKVNNPIRCQDIDIPFFEPIALLFFEKEESRLNKN